MRIGQRVYFIRNNELREGMMVYNDKNKIKINHNNRIYIADKSQVADRVSETIIKLWRTK